MDSAFARINLDNPITYPLRWMVDSRFRYAMDVREYFKVQYQVAASHPKEYMEMVTQVRKLMGDSVDESVIKLQAFIYHKFKYRTDWQKNARSELWEDIVNAWQTKQGDCETLNTLLRFLCILAGSSIQQIYGAIGKAWDGNKSIGHFWLMYFSAKTSSVKPVLYALDTTMFYDSTRFQYRVPFKLHSKRYQKLWYIFNENWCGKIK